jgi:ketose-bisphosphate aldolase
VLATFPSLLEQHSRARIALGAFTCYDLEAARGVLAAGAGRDIGVVLLISRECFAADGGDQLLAGVRAAAERSPTPACVQLDHVSDMELIEAALELGAGAVMADGSKLPFDENVALVQEAKARADASGAAVEGELGHVEGGEDVAAETRPGAYTDPEQAAEFVAATRVDLLAVSIGNVHGAYAAEPRLDWDRLEQIAGRVEAPLSLHGASGLPEIDLRTAVRAGIRKVNANTELREAYLNATHDGLPDSLDGLRLSALHDAQSAAVRRVVEQKLDALNAVTE